MSHLFASCMVRLSKHRERKYYYYLHVVNGRADCIPCCFELFLICAILAKPRLSHCFTGSGVIKKIFFCSEAKISEKENFPKGNIKKQSYFDKGKHRSIESKQGLGEKKLKRSMNSVISSYSYRTIMYKWRYIYIAKYVYVFHSQI